MSKDYNKISLNNIIDYSKIRESIDSKLLEPEYKKTYRLCKRIHSIGKDMFDDISIML